MISENGLITQVIKARRSQVGKGVENKTNETNGSNQVTPHVHTFVVDHEQTPYYLPLGVKAYSVTTPHMFVVYHEVWHLV